MIELHELQQTVVKNIAALGKRVYSLEVQEFNNTSTPSGGYPALSGLTIGQPLRATSPTTAAFGLLDLANLNATTGILPSARGGTGVNNGIFELTFPATGVAALATGVSGGQNIYGGTGANDDLILEGTSHATKTNSYVVLQPNGGNVGIGISAPTNVLSVSKDQNATTYVSVANADAGAGAGAGFIIYQSTNQKAFFTYSNLAATAQIGTVVTDPLLFLINNTEKMRLTNDGNLGLGVTAFGNAAVRVHALGNGTAPTTFPADMIQMYSVDTDGVAGAAGFHVHGELGDRYKFGAGFAEAEFTRTLAASEADEYAAALVLDPGYSGAFTVTRHNYIDIQDVSLAASAAVTNAAVLRFDAAAGTHKAVDAGTTKTTPGTVNAWPKININGTIYFIPAYTSKTT